MQSFSWKSNQNTCNDLVKENAITATKKAGRGTKNAIHHNDRNYSEPFWKLGPRFINKPRFIYKITYKIWRSYLVKLWLTHGKYNFA